MSDMDTIEFELEEWELDRLSKDLAAVYDRKCDKYSKSKVSIVKTDDKPAKYSIKILRKVDF